MNNPLLKSLKQTRPFGSVHEETMVNLLKTAWVVQNAEASLLKDYGLTRQQYNVLRILRGAANAAQAKEGSVPDGLPCLEVGQRMIEKLPDITRLLDRMQRATLVTRKRDTQDRRVVLVTLTLKGRDLVDSIDKPLADYGKSCLGHMSEDDLRQLNTLLNRARETMDE